MRDEEYLFYSDINEKKRTGRSASKRNRTGKGAVRLPSDYMTAKEKRAMNGEVVTMSLREPMDWTAFRRVPDDLKSEYIQSLQDRFDVTYPMLAKMFGVCEHTVKRELARIGHPLGMRGKRKAAVDAFNEWLGQKAPVEKPDTKHAEKPDTKHKVLTAEIAAITTPDELALMLKMLFGAAPRKYHVVSVE